MTLKEQIEKKRKRNREYMKQKRTELKNLFATVSPIKNMKKHENNLKKLFASVSPIKNMKKHENNLKNMVKRVLKNKKK